MKAVYSRVVLKLSGEALVGEQGFGLDPAVVAAVADEVRDAHALGVELGLVVGGGNIVRGAEALRAHGVERVTGDHMGMLATVINALAVQAALESRGLETRVMSAIEMREICEPYIRRRAMHHLERKRVVLFAAGTGNPYFTTDTAAALRASEIGAQALLKATNVDGVYTADPRKDPNAKLLREITFRDALEKRLKVMDATAFSLCMENNLPIQVFDLRARGNVVRVLRGEPVGSLVR